MQRFTIETHDRYDMEPDSEGMWVMYDDAQAAIAAAVAAERERCASLCESMLEIDGSRYAGKSMAKRIRDLHSSTKGA